MNTQTNQATRVAICRLPPGSIVTCNTCGREFSLTPSQIKRRDRMCWSCVDTGRRRRGKGKKNAPGPRLRRHDLIRNAVQKALKSGRLVRKPCEVCGSQRVVAHHEDYTKPLQVKWLCALHHAAEHKALAARGWVSNL